MRRIIDLLFPSNNLRLIVFLIAIVLLNGCAITKSVHTVHEEYQPPAKYSVQKGDDIIGQIAYIKLEKGDTLPDIARHFSLGINAVSAANPGVDVWLPEPGQRILLPLSFILPDAPRKGIVINLATMRLFEFKGNRESTIVFTYPVGVGTEERPSPQGAMYVARKVSLPTWHVPPRIAEDHRKKGDILPAAVPPGPDNPLGEYALYLSKPTYLVHGTNKPASIGLRATNGCIRLYPEDIKKLFENTPVKTPVYMTNQPYLIGQFQGTVYLEVHASLDNVDNAEFDKMYKKLKDIEKEFGRKLDWDKVKKVLAEARGIPVPIFEIRQGSLNGNPKPVEFKHPDQLYGKPDIPEMRADAWSVLVAELTDEIDAVRLASMINHQGPPIPARVVSKRGAYQVVAGPYKDPREANKAIKQLKVDMEIDAKLIQPDMKK